MSDSEHKGPPVILDDRRGMAAQRATDQRRHSSEVKADQEVLRRGRAELEKVLFADPAADWPTAINRAVYLLRCFAATPDAQDPRFQKMISDVLEDFRRLADGPSDRDRES